MMKSHNHIYGSIVIVLSALLTNMPVGAEPTTSSHQKECVVLVHGMARGTSSMRKLETYLLSYGYKTVNLSYPSTRESIERLAEDYIPAAIAQCGKDQGEKIHFVTHSLGGILVRQYLQAHSLPKGSRLVMLAPPNRGTEIVDHLKDFFAYKWFHGPAGQELGTDPESTPNRLKPIGIEVGVIAGDRSYNPIFSALIPGPDDGMVSVERAKLREMTDFLVASSSHTFIVTNHTVMKQVVHFLKYGKFDRSQEKRD
jgi:triacylglycerol lipase